MNFQGKLERIVKNNNSLLCVGLDSDLERVTGKYKKLKHPQFEFNRWIIDQTHDLVCAYKPNSAFYEAEGLKGTLALKFTCHYLKKNYPQIPIILDAKRGDIGSSNKGYVKFAFDFLGVDAITLHPYLGRESLTPFLELKDKGLFILCHTSNLGANELQDLNVIPGGKAAPESLFDSGRARYSLARMTDKIPLYRYVAKRVAEEWNRNGNCMLVVGATYPKELKEIRKITGERTILIPGIGAQGGDVEKTVKAGLNSKKKGIIVNSSRGIIFSENPRTEAKKLRNKINFYRI
ncbi:orotidine 5'-phosphate decarboxylase [Candidatus Roizmanbacteria bacterium RIFCSPHIGHO2_01_FULL_39_12c]|uniref:Orotidine-5'-phosphate decarboxylase n=1 Tax=Candidatus Roizmanbacteria bacterium RIFCSPHIGHO2_01_FULL_39_12c TaxID=1802031 RepID=A0A1F7GE39_9BACT|nr:MAG: orotidine 5'-phosphate decarboxylase [Candidatus Roizmanbacteria bacterium RIFCSPHIGHO2_01_FULL_39_12c]OGK46896.1 MAG: orotidine 5'-phosphate decarboxylase [Candidatus Roizmanbacteria bacterium RIFCSPLOWO2_01_FULL_40_13]